METNTTYSLVHRPRRMRRTENLRRLARETRLSVDHLIAPMFIIEGSGKRVEVDSMPGQFRYSIDEAVRECEALFRLGVPGVALFPAISENLKDRQGTESFNPKGLFPSAIRAIKQAVPDLLVISDVALDPYSSDGHDGVIVDGYVDNDESLKVLTRMALVQAEAGADIIAPSDMMDGRVAAIRDILDVNGFINTAILSYTAKYASAFYGPFRDALDSAPRLEEGIPEDKSTYQMDPANAREALRELALDLEEGADMVMVKPALCYMDVLSRVAAASDVPVATYHVSGEYAMLMAAVRNGWLEERRAVLETLTAFRRAGADIILTYFAHKAAEWLQQR